MKRAYIGYKHWTLEPIPRCFNVGKGQGKRPFDKTQRNHKWKAIVKRYGLHVEVCVEHMTNDEANMWEVENIAKEGTFTLNHDHEDFNDIGCNFTKGGDKGAAGCKFTPEHRKNISMSLMGHVGWYRGKKHSHGHKIGKTLMGHIAWNKNGNHRCSICRKPGHNKLTCKQRTQ